MRSAGVGLGLLTTLAENGGEMALSALSAKAGMAPAKAHRYLVSLVRAGYVEQNPLSGRYALGGQALRVGLVALGRLDVMALATEAIYLLRDQVDEAVLLAIWAAHGPTVVRWAEASRPVTVNVRIGSVMPLLRSATGQVFAAYMPVPIVAPLLDAELKSPSRHVAGVPGTRAAAERLFAGIRAQGLSQVDGQMLPGIRALSAPVYGGDGTLACAVTVLGPAGAFDHALDGPMAEALREATRVLASRLGFSG